jgi:chaperonin GroEL
MQNVGANLEKEVAQKTNDIAGDGRKTTILLYQAIATEGMKLIKGSLWTKILRLISLKPAKVNSIGVKSGIDKASKIAVDYLKTISKPINGNEEITRVATISSKSEEIGKVVAKTVSELGQDAIITVEESPVVGITSEISSGLELDKGFITPYMMTDPARGESVVKDVSILVTDLKLGSAEDVYLIMEALKASGKQDLVIIAEDIVGDALQTVLANRFQNGFITLGVKAPGFGLRKKDYLEDIAITVGATFISKDLGMTMDKVGLDHLGSAERVVSTKDKTTIIGGKGDKTKIDERIATAKLEMETLESKHDKLKVEERIAKLSGGVARIKVGASTDTETKYLKLKVEDAINAVKAALEEGIVPGGGYSLIHASTRVLEAKNEGEYTVDELLGFDILAKAMEIPLKHIAINCGLGDGEEVVNEVKNQEDGGGFDAFNNVFVDNLIESGIIDPLKVERCALENASSGAGMFLTLEVAMAEIPKDKPDMM